MRRVDPGSVKVPIPLRVWVLAALGAVGLAGWGMWTRVQRSEVRRAVIERACRGEDAAGGTTTEQRDRLERLFGGAAADVRQLAQLEAVGTLADEAERTCPGRGAAARLAAWWAVLRDDPNRP